MSWRRGELVFDGVTLNEAAATLTRRFDVPMVITDSLLGRRRVSARFHAETLPQMLDALSMVVNANWTRDGLRIVIAKATP